jgi:hypothetical protein
MPHCASRDLTKALLEHYKMESKRLKGFVSTGTTPNMNNREKDRFSRRQFSAARRSSQVL